MRTTIDSAGRVVIPKALRQRLNLQGGQELELRERDGAIELTVAPATLELVDHADGPAAVPVGRRPLPPLTDEIVRETMESTRR